MLDVHDGDQAPSASEAVRDRVVRLFDYLTKLVELRSRPVRDVDQYERVIWFAELPTEPEVTSVVGQPGRDPDDWLVVRRPRLSPPPPLSPTLHLWVDEDATRDLTSDLSIRDAINVVVRERQDDGTVMDRIDEKRLFEEPLVRSAWEPYRSAWLAWATTRRRVQPVYDLYSSLFDMQQQSIQLGEQYEIVLGLGLLTTTISTGPVRRHVLTARVTLSYEEESGVIRVGPDPEGIALAFETDMLEGEHIAPAALISRLKRDLDDLGTDLFDRAAVGSVLTAWVNGVSTDGFFDDRLEAPARPIDVPIVTFAPAIILRKRSQLALVALYRGLIEKVELGAAIPPLVQGLVEIVEAGATPAVGEDVSGWLADGDEVLFPLPANDEQREIVARLRHHRGVVVLGPPGTGKSHTIANIVSDALAHGRRVLVTSHTGRALEVLVEKLPPDVRDLCVSMVGESRGLSQELQRSITVLLDRSISGEWAPSQIAAKKQRLGELRTENVEDRAGALAAQRRLRERETEVHDLGFGDYRGTFARIAERLAEERERLGWIRTTGESPPPITTVEAQAWLAAERAVAAAPEGRSLEIVPNIADLPATPEFVDLLAELEEARRDVNHEPALEVHPAWTPLSESDPRLRSELRQAMTALRRAADQVLHLSQPWVRPAVEDVLDALEQPWIARGGTVERAIERMAPTARVADEVRVTGLGGLDPRAVVGQATALRDHLVAGGGWGFGPFKPAAVKAAPWVARLGVDGTPPRSVEQLDRLLAFISFEVARDDLLRGWGDYLPSLDTAATVALGQVREVQERIVQVLALQPLRDRAAAAVVAIDDLPPPAWRDPLQLAEWERVTRSVDATRRVVELEARLGHVESDLRRLALAGGTAPEVLVLADAVSRRDPTVYRGALGSLGEVAVLAARQRERDVLFGRVVGSAPELAWAVRSEPERSDWTVWFADFERAWAFARATAWLTAQLADGDRASVDAKLLLLTERARGYDAQFGAVQAWESALSRLTQQHRQSLAAYAQYMKKRGKGKGKYAATFLQKAQAEMNACIDAVPAWVMPTYRLAETISPGFEPFDIAVVDEASQSGVEALFVWALAKQVVIVGDDQQISPDAVGVDQSVVHQYQNQLLSGIPQAGLFGPQESLFDQAAIRYPGQVRLREHFRCMPEIIEFSNRLCYQHDPLIPVRQFGTDRLPPLRSVHVAGAETGDGVNRREATAIVDTIAECCTDPAYEGRTMGVISLTGDRQAQLIRTMLIERIGPNEMLARRIKCGDAYAFQSDQRQVMFLSMVASPRADGSRLAALGADTIKRRFNVAASRAEDQEWLFHSVTLSDLNPDCFRAKLLSHFTQPQSSIDALEFGPVSANEHNDHFDSLFEQRVFLRLREHGFRVIPQYPVHGFRIDLVVLGEHQKLAIECDGDTWHGPEAYEHDAARQRDLERCGWRFFRVQESAFYLDPDQALAPLWRLLSTQGIGPEIPAASVVRPAPPATPDVGAVASVYGTVVETPTAATIAPATAFATALARDEVGVATPAAELPKLEAAPTRTATHAAERTDGTLGLDEADTALLPPRLRHLLEPIRDLEPYQAWRLRPVPTPTSPSIAGALQDIIEVEGPMTVARLYAVYVRASGGGRLSHRDRSLLNQTLNGLLSSRRILAEKADASDGMADWVVRSPASPRVLVRQRGNRALLEIPRSEVAAIAQRARHARPTVTEGGLVTTVLAAYGAPNPAGSERAYIESAITGPTARPAPASPTSTAIAQPAALSSTRPEPREDEPRVRPPVIVPQGAKEFSTVVDETINEALALGGDGLHRLGAAWVDDEDVRGVRDAFLEEMWVLGVSMSLEVISKTVTSKLPDVSGKARGAVVDAAIARYLRPVADPIGVELLLRPWQVATSPLDDAGAPQAARARELCQHGRPMGSCMVVTCRGHFLGGIDLGSQ